MNKLSMGYGLLFILMIIIISISGCSSPSYVTPTPKYYTSICVWNNTTSNSEIHDSTVWIKHNGTTIAIIHGGYGAFGYDTLSGGFEYTYDAIAPGYGESTGSFNPVPSSTYIIEFNQ